MNDKNFTTQTLPIYDINFKAIHNITIQYDDEVRRLYQYNIVRNNRKASISAVNILAMKDLNTDQFQKSNYWINWQQKVIYLLNQENLILCPNFPIIVNNSTI